jgi:hypothetical protein
MNPAARCPGPKSGHADDDRHLAFVVTGTRGEYVLTNLPVGPYQLDVKLDGFTTYEQNGITLKSARARSSTSR